MGQNTEYNRKMRALSHLKDLYSKAKSFKMTSSDINKEFMQIMDTDLAKATQLTRQYIRGYRDALSDSLWREMEFCYRVNGIWYTTAKDTNKPRWDTLDDYNMSGKECVHMWRNTEKPYGEISIA